MNTLLALIPKGEPEFVAIIMAVSRRSACWLLFLRWTYRLGRLGGAQDGAERWPVHA